MTLDIEGVLAGHRSWDYGGPGVIKCECDWRSERLGPEWNSRKDDRHRAHVAAAVRAEVRAWLESEDAELVAAAGVEKYAYPGLSASECERAAQYALAALAEQVAQVAPSRVPGEGS